MPRSCSTGKVDKNTKPQTLSIRGKDFVLQRRANAMDGSDS